MTLLREERDDFAGAAEELGLVPLFVEKDYWVTQVLRVPGRDPRCQLGNAADSGSRLDAVR